MIEEANRKELERAREMIHKRDAVLMGELCQFPLERQIDAFKGGFPHWLTTCRNTKVSNHKYEQLCALDDLNRRIEGRRQEAAFRLESSVSLSELHDSKKKQLQSKLFGRTQEECRRWQLALSAEWAFERWVRAQGLPCVDLNASNEFAPRDYRVVGKEIDVKTTISMTPQPLKLHWSPDDRYMNLEIVCGITSHPADLQYLRTRHCIQGIFDRGAYRNLPGLLYLGINRPFISVCHLQPPDIYFGVDELIGSAPLFDPDVLEYCATNSLYPRALFTAYQQPAAHLIDKLLPRTLSGLTPIIRALLERGSIQYLPHFLADYFAACIRNKLPIEFAVIERHIWPIYRPSDSQIEYLRVLSDLSQTLPHVECAHHPGERMEEMDIDIDTSFPRLLVYARCSRQPALRTTVLAYCWITGETLSAADPDILRCDVRGCGCLTHWVSGRRIGRRFCPFYGEKAFHSDFRPSYHPVQIPKTHLASAYHGRTSG